MNGIDGKTALVTGSASGIGRETARRFAREGARVVVADIDEEGGRETVDLIEADGGTATFVNTDVTDPEDVQAMVETAVESYGGLDVAHNNAGGMAGAPPDLVADRAEEDFDRVVELNLKGVWLGLKYELQAMLETGGGAIVNTSSHAGLRAVQPGLGPYNASKHGVIGITRAAAVQYAGDGIRVNAVCPGITATPLTMEDASEGQVEEWSASVPMGRMVQPEEIASGVVWMCSEDASMLTGETMTIDGGQLAE